MEKGWYPTQDIYFGQNNQDISIVMILIVEYVRIGICLGKNLRVGMTNGEKKNG